MQAGWNVFYLFFSFSSLEAISSTSLFLLQLPFLFHQLHFSIFHLLACHFFYEFPDLHECFISSSCLTTQHHFVHRECLYSGHLISFRISPSSNFSHLHYSFIIIVVCFFFFFFFFFSLSLSWYEFLSHSKVSSFFAGFPRVFHL